jgi:hypothetical protein
MLFSSPVELNGGSTLSQEVESEIINGLDSLRPIDTTTGRSQYSSKYDHVEKQFKLLLEAYECSIKLDCENRDAPCQHSGRQEKGSTFNKNEESDA